MNQILAADESWAVLKRFFPVDWEELAVETNALVRKLRSFKDTESVMRTLLLHIANGYSLRETVVRAKMAEIADVTDVALLKRLQCSEDWLKTLSLRLLRERGFEDRPVDQSKTQLRLVDGTYVKEPGKTGSEWRIHYSLRLPDLHCDYFKLTPSEGKDTGESFKQFPAKQGDCIVGDRAYSTAQGIAYLTERGAYCLVRVNTGALKFYQDEEELNLSTKLSELQQEQMCGEWPVDILAPNGGKITGRLCAKKKSEAAAKLAIEKLKKQANKRQRQIKPETLEYAKYVIVFTTLPLYTFTTNHVLEWYRLRWQIELSFKRLKSLASFGHLPKYDEVSARAWLYGKLLVGLMTEKLLRHARAISPWGY
jgi:hypothetical protein